MAAFTYPAADHDDALDDYHGTPVADPYRWLEDPEDPRTRHFVADQNAISLPYLRGLPERSRMDRSMRRLWNIARTSAPVSRGGVSVWSHNDGLQDQPVLMAESPDTERRTILDPNLFSDDGAVAITQFSLSDDGALLAYNVAESGSDWQVIRVLDTASGTDLSDEIRHVKFSSVAWLDDGFFYSRFPEQDVSLTGLSMNQSVWFHRIGTDQREDVQVFANPENPELGYDAILTPDHRFLCLIEWIGTSRSNGLLLSDLSEPDTGFVRLFETGVGIHLPLLHHDGSLVLHTDVDAANGRIVSVDLANPEVMADLIPEGDAPLAAAGAAAGSIYALSLADASHRIDLYGTDGSHRQAIELPEPGTVSAVNGHFDDPAIYIGFESFLRPPSAFRWEAGNTTLFAGAEPPPVASEIDIERIHAVSSDGAEVGMFLVSHRDTQLPAPVELYGYGGFAIDVTPMFSSARLAFIEAGGIVASTNLRGGTELGERWHRQGMLGNKQQVFDDFAACAEELIERGIGNASTIAANGRSNGGLLTAAVMLQRPELFGAVVSHVPVTDMLRYQLFTAGRYWTVEYGNAVEDPAAFEWLIRYSPYHRALDVDAASLPPVLITTAETDDRVVPMHSLKLAAALQHAAGGTSDGPILVRIETRAGHGLGKPVSKLIEEAADVYGFILHHCSPDADPR